MDLDRMLTRAEGRRLGTYRAFEHVRPGLCLIQGDQAIANQAGAAFRGDLNNELQALVTLSSGASAPGTTYAHQLWADTTNNLLKKRNAANSAWIAIRTLDEVFVLSRSSNTILGVSDVGKALILTSTFTQTFTAAATLGDGWWVQIRNDGTGLITLDPNSAETIDGNTTTTLAAGESCYIVCNGASFKTIGRAAPVALHGQCRLAKSGANVVLSPFNGNKIVINGVPETIPDAGVSLGVGGLSASTLYYIYAFMSSGTMTLEASATAYATQAGTGVQIKNGDATRTLAGLARTNGSTAWADSATQRFTRSWFNDPGIGGISSFSTQRTTTSLSYVELNTEIRVEFIVWTNEVVELFVSGAGQKSDASNSCSTSIGIDGTTAENVLNVGQSGGGASVRWPVGMSLAKTGLSEGYHFATVLGQQNGSNTGTCGWDGGAAGAATTLNVRTRR